MRRDYLIQEKWKKIYIEREELQKHCRILEKHMLTKEVII